MPNAGDIIKALDFPAAVTDQEATAGTTTSVTFTATLTGGVACEAVFVAPTSGKVTITVSGRLGNSGANQTYLGFAVRQGGVVGSGTVVQAAADQYSLQHSAIVDHHSSMSNMVTGLTPGATYNVQQQFRTSAGTATYAYKELTVTPAT